MVIHTCITRIRFYFNKIPFGVRNIRDAIATQQFDSMANGGCAPPASIPAWRLPDSGMRPVCH